MLPWVSLTYNADPVFVRVQSEISHLTAKSHESVYDVFKPLLQCTITHALKTETSQDYCLLGRKREREKERDGQRDMEREKFYLAERQREREREFG